MVAAWDDQEALNGIAEGDNDEECGVTKTKKARNQRQRAGKAQMRFIASAVSRTARR
jgi:hypothetical protein